MKTVHEMSEQITFLAFTQPPVASWTQTRGTHQRRLEKKISDDVWKLYNV